MFILRILFCSYFTFTLKGIYNHLRKKNGWSICRWEETRSVYNSKLGKMSTLTEDADICCGKSVLLINSKVKPSRQTESWKMFSWTWMEYCSLQANSFCFPKSINILQQEISSSDETRWRWWLFLEISLEYGLDKAEQMSGKKK